MSVHPVKTQYPDLVGDCAVDDVRCCDFVWTDLWGYGVVLLLFLSVIGFVQPPETPQALRAASLSEQEQRYQNRVDKIHAVIDSTRSVAVEKGLNRYEARLDKLAQRVNELTGQVPLKQVIVERMAARDALVALVPTLINERPLTEYAGLTRLKDIKPLEDRHVEQAKQVLQIAQQWQEPLSDTEIRAKALLAQFDGQPTPNDEQGLFQLLSEQWHKAYLALMRQWQAVRTLESEVLAAAKREQDTLTQPVEAPQPVRKPPANAEPARSSEKPKPKPAPRKSESRREKQRKAEQLLN